MTDRHGDRDARDGFRDGANTHSTTNKDSETDQPWLSSPADLVSAMSAWISEHVPSDMPFNAAVKVESLWMYARPAQDKYGTAAAIAKVRSIIAEDVARWRKKNPAAPDWAPAKRKDGVI